MSERDPFVSGWQKFKKALGCMFGLVRLVMGTRSVKTGVQPMVRVPNDNNPYMYSHTSVYSLGLKRGATRPGKLFLTGLSG